MVLNISLDLPEQVIFLEPLYKFTGSLTVYQKNIKCSCYPIVNLSNNTCFFGFSRYILTIVPKFSLFHWLINKHPG